MVRKTVSGNLLLRLKKDTNKTTEVKTIAETNTGAEIQIRASTVAVEIRGLDADVTHEELAIAITERTLSLVSSENVKTLKPGVSGKVVAFLLLPAKIANELVTGPRLRIGWANCTVRIRIPMDRCGRCLSFGHRRITCEGPDRKDTCLNCWKTGHVRRDCKTEAHCGLCEEEGDSESGNHFSGGGKCSAFRRFLQKSKSK